MGFFSLRNQKFVSTQNKNQFKCDYKTKKKQNIKTNQTKTQKKRRTRLNEKGEKREQHEFGDKLCFFSVDKLYIKNILTLLKKYVSFKLKNFIFFF
jgi:hypothetical protein